ELISGFIDTYLRLNAAEEQQLERELKQANLVEEEKVMQIVTSWMEKGIEQGITQGELRIIKKQLKRRFINIEPSLEKRIDSLSSEKLENLSEAIFDLQSLEDLIKWLDAQPDLVSDETASE
ncbi:MAG TPA: DUF4351 domain-containing protein, partial [Nostocaceae cyanobacterium]|nr:DUF4351 domain-containing protein [Nostocaceae cyanobacterium]